MKKPTVRQCKLIEQELGRNPAEYLVKKWHEIKDGVEVCLVNRETGEKRSVMVEK